MGESPVLQGERRFDLRRHLEPGALRRQLAADVRAGLGSRPYALPPKYFYDARGSRLFQEITRLPEYYQTRTERSILERCADGLVEALAPRALVEFGSGSAGKTRVLLDAMHRAGTLEGYGPIDVSPEPLRKASRALLERYAGLRIHALIADFESPLRLPFADLPRLVIFLGSTIGNLEPEASVAFLRRVGGQLGADDGFLVGFDLVKDPATLLAAYDDAAGVTEAFNRNLLRVLNRELAADFPPEGFRHRADWNGEESRIEIRLVSDDERTVRIPALGMEVPFRRGEAILTELSHKYTRASATDLLEAAGLRAARWETDPEDRFALALARKRSLPRS